MFKVFFCIPKCNKKLDNYNRTNRFHQYSIDFASTGKVANIYPN